MPIEYDPDARPQVTEEMLRDAKELGLHPINVICDEQGAKVGDQSGLSFIALVPSVPRQGDRIGLEDGRTCEVQRVYFKVVSRRDDTGKISSIILVPSVYAILIYRGA